MSTPKERILTALGHFIKEVGTDDAKLLRSVVRMRRELRLFDDHLLMAKGLKTHPTCLECEGIYSEDYMVHDAVWDEAVPNERELYAAMVEQGLPKMGIYLHLRCLETRLGRRVTVSDLSPAPINDGIRYFVAAGR